ncbi:prenyltransferase/squalene oxidase repeat-containing protein [uncultured Nostoc sp.]|uniref:prenyltransferase/squalene oxidase repeat-containing protein n=1 Tax=uncultured Nostoc sp. TaxID=340711 RepID=UPI0035CC658A
MSLQSFEALSSQPFSRHIQEEIEVTRKAVGRLLERWSDKVALSSNSQVTIYDYYPYLFLKAFPSLTLADIRPLNLASRLFASSIFLYDKMMDCTANVDLSASILSTQARQLEAYYLLHQMFPPKAVFWEHFRDYVQQYAKACVYEHRFASGDQPWQEYSEAVALQIAVGKNGISKTTIAGLVELAQDDSLLKPLIEAINHFNIACQMLDDLLDWKEDLYSGIPSLLLSRILHERPTQGNKEEMTRRRDILAREIYYGGHARYIVELALESLERADRITANLLGSEWHTITAKLRHRCQALLQDIEQIVNANLHRVRSQPNFVLTLPSAQSPWQEIIWDGLRFIVQQWRFGFGEARHIMHLTQEEEFSAAQEYHYGDVFQRALIADALCDANQLLHGQFQQVINYEASYLVNCRLTSGIGGWSYFSSVPELAPDADDLGQVIQVLLRAGRKAEVAEYCETPLAVLLQDNVRADGSFETWIVPATGRTPQQERQVEFNQYKWGTGPDNEVMANLLYALMLYDQERFTQTIWHGMTYLESQQQGDGSWVSRWYYGSYYGTYVCLRLFAVAQPNSPTIQRALSFLRSHQRDDGGWGLKDESDPLSTALALLGLAIAQECNGDTGDLNRVERALVYLQHSQGDDNSWPSIQFIRPRMNEPYGSRTITSTYVVKAAIAWNRLLDNASVNQLDIVSGAKQ